MGSNGGGAASAAVIFVSAPEREPEAVGGDPWGRVGKLADPRTLTGNAEERRNRIVANTPTGSGSTNCIHGDETASFEIGRLLALYNARFLRCAG